MSRETIPIGQQQIVNKYYGSVLDLYHQVQDLGTVREHKGRLYYLHIDHMQIVPDGNQELYGMIIVFHRVYLVRETGG